MEWKRARVRSKRGDISWFRGDRHRMLEEEELFWGAGMGAEACAGGMVAK